MTLRGNVFVTNPDPGNYSKIMTFANDTGAANFGVVLTATWNTFLITKPYQPGFEMEIFQVNSSSVKSANVTFSNNIVAGNQRPIF